MNQKKAKQLRRASVELADKDFGHLEPEEKAKARRFMYKQAKTNYKQLAKNRRRLY